MLANFYGEKVGGSAWRRKKTLLLLPSWLFSVYEQAIFLLEGHIKRCVNQSPIFSLCMFFPNIYKMLIKIPFVQLRLMFFRTKHDL